MDDTGTTPAMTDLNPVVDPAPRWVTDLANPPPYKSKPASIPDPPGYSSQAVSGPSKASNNSPSSHRIR